MTSLQYNKKLACNKSFSFVTPSVSLCTHYMMIWLYEHKDEYTVYSLNERIAHMKNGEIRQWLTVEEARRASTSQKIDPPRFVWREE